MTKSAQNEPESNDCPQLSQSPFHPLSPTDEAENCEIYLDAIDWALANSDKIKNIAISGPYGSGKSSVIKTFIKKHNSTKYKFLNISLATFKDVKQEEQKDTADQGNNSTDKTVSNDTLRLIELSILQQLFFHEKDSQLPDSRFIKIRNHKKMKLALYSLGFITLIISILFLLTPDFLAKFAIIEISSTCTYNLIRWAASLYTWFCLFCIVFKSSRSLIAFSIKNLGYGDAKIEIDNGISKSILNNHLDEIIYFFEATSYNVVVIEDLDRFEQSEVFTKLREINSLINNSEKIKRPIIFIYAIKDDMFLDKDRAKFFDFMIPIIPVVDYSNSGDKLRKIITDNNYKISTELMDDLSMFVDDMRLLYNIMNEFSIYSGKIDSLLDQNKLLSMIVYKNIFPNDFTLLSKNEGDLYKAISSKQDYIKNEKSVLDDHISTLRDKIKQIEELKLNNLNELRVVYVAKAIGKLMSNNSISLQHNTKFCNYFNFCTNEEFDRIKNGVINYIALDHWNRAENHVYNLKFEDLEKEIHPNVTYQERELLILNRNKINELKKEIEQLHEQKNQIQKCYLKDLLTDRKVSFESGSEKQNDLINILLRNGYIDENYMDYISIFHEGALTKADNQFLINVKIEKQTSFDYRLNKTNELLKKINDFAFEKEFILNFYLIDSLLEAPNQIDKKRYLFKQLCNEQSKSIEFIDMFIDNTKNTRLFVQMLCREWHNVWSFIENKSQFTDEKKVKYFCLIIRYADVKDITDIFANHKNYINKFSNFLNLELDADKRKDKLKQIINDLDLKFESIDQDSPDELLDYILANNNYAINTEMISILLKQKKLYNSDLFEKGNYGFILSTNLQAMINYIEANIEDYIKSVYLKLDNNSEENIDSYIKLLNNKNIGNELKEDIVVKVETIVDDLEKINILSVCYLLLQHSKAKTTWDNFLDLYESEENKLSQDLINYLNIISNAEILSKTKMTTEQIEGKGKFSELCKSLIHSKEIILESYSLLVKSIPWCYETFEIDKLSSDRIFVLIENNKVNPTIKSYNLLKQNFNGTNINLLEKHYDKFNNLLDEITIDSRDLEQILKSGKFKTSDKFVFIKKCDDSIILSSNEIIKNIAQLLVDNKEYQINDNLMPSFFTNQSVPYSNRISLFNLSNIEISRDLLEDFLNSLPEVYKEITDTSKKATLVNNPLNKTLLEKLKQLDYISSISELDKGLRVNHKRKE